MNEKDKFNYLKLVETNMTRHLEDCVDDFINGYYDDVDCDDDCDVALEEAETYVNLRNKYMYLVC
jgi:hypothetical protein